MPSTTTQLFKVEKVLNNEIIKKISSKNVPQIEDLCKASIVLSYPTSNVWYDSFNISANGEFINTELNNNESIYSNVYSNIMITSKINVTIPSASKSNPVHLMFYLLHFYNWNYYSYSYNIFKVDSPEPQDFEFKNYVQNIWGELYTHFRMDDPLGNYPDFTLNSLSAEYVTIDKLKADAGQFYS